MIPSLNPKGDSSVSFSRGKEDDDANDKIHVSLPPYIGTYMARGESGAGCCGVGLPVPFERAAPRSWWNPKFDSEILEEQFKTSAFPQVRLRFRFALAYILVVTVSWLVYFVMVGVQREAPSWPAVAATFSTVGALVSAVLYLTYLDCYRSYVLPTSLSVASTLCLLSLLFLALVPPHKDGLTLVGHFALASEILLLIYTMIPMPLYACIGICTAYSFSFELLTAYMYGTEGAAHRRFFNEQIIPISMVNSLSEALQRHASSTEANWTSNSTFGPVNTTNHLLSKEIDPSLTNSIVESISGWDSLSNDSQPDGVNLLTMSTIRILMQICIHLIGLHILIMTLVRMRGTFMKVGQSLLVRRQLEMEKQLKEKMIHSVMPPKVADWLMEESEREREREDSLKKGSIPLNGTDIRSLFRPFNMHSMEDVSILFADIVGFTRMSSNKTAEELVAILNDLFERFDDLCEQHGCEKISTLGDCYYCVSGCPEPRPDHARCCVEMGLAMIEAIEQFDIERREGVNMRVGVHTGTVLCGLVGTKRFKFDVWSNDVTLANKLESTGKPGRVHLSEKTLGFLEEEYLTEEGDPVNGIKSYFVRGRKSDLVTRFTSNEVPMNISPLLPPRQRLSSYTCQQRPRQHYLRMVTDASSQRAKASSLPSILDSDNDGNNEDEEEDESDNKSPTSIASCGKKKTRSRPWRYLRRQRTDEGSSPLEPASGDVRISLDPKADPEESPKDARSNGYSVTSVPISNGIDTDPRATPVSPLLPRRESISHASSICSRKDSGIRSTSRRSSIQQQLYLMNGMAQGDLLGHRVSGYYTSSSTLNSTQEPSSAVPPYPFPPMVTDTFGACFHKLRKQSDLQLIRCVQDNVSSQRSYFVKPPLSRVTLFFKNKEMEKEYRENAHRSSGGLGGNPPTLATSRFNTYFDILISALVYSAITASLFLLCEPTVLYLVFGVFATLIEALAVSLCIWQLMAPNTNHATITKGLFEFFSRWYPWHVCGAVLVALPMVSILMNFTCSGLDSGPGNFEYYYGYLALVGLVHFCNFTQLNCWMKNLLVTLTGVLFIYLVASHAAHHVLQRAQVAPGSRRGSLEGTLPKQMPGSTGTSPYVERNTSLPGPEERPFDILPGNGSRSVEKEGGTNSDLEMHPEIPKSMEVEQDSPLPKKLTDGGNEETRRRRDVDVTREGFKVDPGNGTESRSRAPAKMYSEEYSDRATKEKQDRESYGNGSEVFLDMGLLLLLVWFLNREFEISYRMTFHGNAVAARDKARVQSMKNQADWLLHNIIPKYVADQLKTTAKYSQNHKSVGIIFASIVNFNELYDESYLGGKEYLRVLNELIGDFDELLERPEFANVEKIKTIGSTFMAASGLNPQVRERGDDVHGHLYELLDFTIAMHRVIYNFNRDLLGFKLVLRIGYNYGDVTAGVIGATKLYYDIWGDAVNIASRMDSTGVAGRTQIASNCLEVLSRRYEFEPRGSVYVKGKDNMNVFLLKGKRGSADDPSEEVASS
ncbi:adenylate cyclase type 9 [Orussus abietinus]|uniref:adenylate cyclase type 9 n=1 Tax=Orussus abietinus TaxID=222816 RepID=UPI0006262E79|nr:adenylate cyclase type 9 [Orussus abietinus]